MKLITKIKNRVKGSALEPIAWELYYFYTKVIQPKWQNSSGPSQIAKVLNRLGVNYRVELGLPKQWEDVMHNSREDLSNAAEVSGSRVLFATCWGFGPPMLAEESVLAKSLQLRGAQVFSLACNKALPGCAWNPCGNHNPLPDDYGPRMFQRTRLDKCRVCTQAIFDMYSHADIPCFSLVDYIYPDDMERLTRIVDGLPYEEYDDFSYRGINVAEHARSTVLRSLLRGTLQDDDYTRWLYRRYLISAMLLTDLTERLFESVRPERVVAVHGIYLEHGTICEVARKHGIPVVVYGIPYRKGTIWLSHNDTYHRTLVTEPVSEWEHLTLSEEQERRLDAYLGSKLSGGRDYVNYHPNPVLDKEVLIKELGLNTKNPVISMFTNVLWDAQIVYDSNTFDDILDWLFQTIDYFKRRSDLQLVIRVHPAETKGGYSTNQPIVGEIRCRYPVLPENIKLIPPESDLSSYTLVDMSHAALIYGTKMGLEIAIRGVPLIVAGETLSRGKGFSYDVETKEEYFDLLDRVIDLPRNSSEMIARARKFAYHLFFRRMIDFPFFYTDPFRIQGAELCFQDLGALLPGKNNNLDAVCDGILNGSHFVVD